MAPSWLSRQFFLTIRGKIMLAFTVLATIAGGLGLYAVNCVVESGRLVVRTYDKPLMAISYARLAQADFNALELAIDRRARDFGIAVERDARIDQLEHSVKANIGFAEERSATPASAAAAQTASQAFALWCVLRAAPAAPGQKEALAEQTERVLESLDLLGALTTDDGFRDRERSLALIERYRNLSIFATIQVLLIGCLVALTLARKMVTLIAAASEAAGRIAAGELNTDIRPSGKDELGQLLVSMSVMRDNIRQMREREIAARRSAQSQLADAIEGARSGVALIGQDDRVLTANSRIRQFFPGPRVAFAAGERVPAEVDEALAEPTGEMRLEDGRWIRLTHSPAKEGGFVLIASDISFLKEREEALRVARDEAEAANRAKTDFLTNMSHELRTPLSAVIGFSEMIAGETFGPVGQPQYKEFADDILHAGRHLMDVITDILDIAKAQSGTIELRTRTIRPEAVMRAAIRIVYEKARDANIRLTTHIGDDLPAIDADTVRLRQVLLNLLSNSIKFTPAGGSIDAEVRRHPEGVALQIRDSGTGMAQDDIPRALQPFVQVDASQARRHGGTGLGLPLTKIFVELHGGRLEIESRVNEGTRVTVVLPAAGETLEHGPCDAEAATNGQIASPARQDGHVLTRRTA
ncbi:MAG: HAMP domain-containing protein [Acetobacteraceae bacterium]|nr:HAMP domain-containing protein [Acetobacteraceae bacterium]